MAEDWLKWTYGLAGKREIRVIASRCHRDRHEVAARVMVLWEWLETNLSDADIDSETGDASVEMGENWKSQIDDITGLPNFAEVLASADVCWVIPARSGGRVTFPRLGRHVGKLAKTRAMEARKKSRQRRDNVGTRVREEKITNTLSLPRDIDEVIEFVKTQKGWTEEVARHWFADRTGQGWIKANGHAVQNWKADLEGWMIRQAQGNAPGGRFRKTRKVKEAQPGFATW